mmetsp:Transcript_56273/g.101140  ORF Transcript_56273/g.101140 Transcript_56273/m.101140 type:complete len:315 (-) Transcript_56273:450-1394(-)
MFVLDGGQLATLRVLDDVHELVEEEEGVDGTAAGLRVELDREPRLLLMSDTFIGGVVRICEQGRPAIWQARVIHCKAVVLRCNVAAARAQVHARLVHATVSELHLVSLGACSNGQQLVSQANAENRHCWPLLHHLAEDLHGGDALLRVARSVAEKQPVELLRGVVVVPGNNLDAALQVVQEEAQNVAFHAAVDAHDQRGWAVGIVIPGQVESRLSHRDLSDEVAQVRVLPSRCTRLLANGHSSKLGAFLAETLRDCARVDAEDTGHSLLFHPCVEALHGGIVRGREGILCHNNGYGIDLLAFEELGDPVLVELL